MKTLVLDAETKDPYLKTYGQGWAFKYNYPEYDFKVLGFAYIDCFGNKDYINDWNKLQELLDNHDALVFHNSMYDLGCLMVLDKYNKINFDLRKHMKYDTLILAKLFNQYFGSYSLDYLAKKFNQPLKQSIILHDFAWSTGIYQQAIKEERNKEVKTRPSEKVMENFCKKHMDLFPFEIVADYAIADVEATKGLFNCLLPKVEDVELGTYSKLQEIVVDMKCKGVRIDLKVAHELKEKFTDILEESLQELYEINGEEFNINSPIQLAEFLVRQGYDVPRKDPTSKMLEKGITTGNYRTDKIWRSTQTGKPIELINKAKQATTAGRNFVQKIIDYQDIIPDKYKTKDVGILFPSLKILGATQTGRDSSGGGTGSKEISIHQIPKRDKVFGKPCRGMFLPYENEKFIHVDYAAQESRLQVHYAKVLKCEGVDQVVDEWNTNPDMSFHDKVAEITQIDRNHAKTINLGLSYGMGAEALFASLQVTESQGVKILDQYHTMLPFMKQLQETCTQAMSINRYIKTIGGRKLRLGIGKENGLAPEKNGLSKLIQGSAADQTKKAMALLWEKGISILFAVHDELNLSSSNPEQDFKIIEECMVGAFNLKVPVRVDGFIGNSWRE